MIMRAIFLLLFLGQAALALPVGQWRSDFYGAYGNIKLSEQSFEFELEENGQATWGFSGALVQALEPSGESPGKLVVGPIEGSEMPFEVIWFFPQDGPRTRFFREETSYKTQAEAEASKVQITRADASLFLTSEFFAQCDALPVLPEPDKAQLVTLLKEAVQKRQAQQDLDLNSLMEELMIAKGYHPSKSQEPFGKAVDKYSDDAEIDALLTELGS